ncbi:5081_t:CDS:2 [Ambispora gerdemannii]|uniref:5081_t:CDS:1 n=2 Tax=Ambispora gerdemannii TaxID=144530 RepID=A0A9N9FQW5_9GLOM|nr:5081_t:CDS:2 [Ambispora gerdemannii]
MSRKLLLHTPTFLPLLNLEYLVVFFSTVSNHFYYYLVKTQSFEVDFYTKDDDFSFSSDGISNIFFDFYLTNSSYNSLELTSYLAATFIDHSSGLLNANKMVNDALNKQLTEKNTYVLSPNQRNYVGFKRFKNESLANTPRNVFGAPQPDHENDFFIETRFQTSNYPATTEKLHELFFSSLSVFLLTYEIPIIKEKKTKDLLGIISSFGGAFSLSFFVYHVLFGTNRMRPWGVCQRLYKIRSPIQRKLVKTLGPELPLVRDNVDTEETVSLKDLQKQVNSLELLLREYIIDFSYLAESRKNVTRWENSNVGSK